MRPAFTIVELLVAIVVLTVGVLALAATAGMVAAHVGDGGRLTSSAHAARSVLDSLRTLPCERAVSGAELRRGMPVTWTVARDSLTVSIEVVVGSTVRRRNRRDTHRAVIACAGS